jgi:hypothetical protein
MNADAMIQFYENIFETVIRRVLDERNATFPTLDIELATQLARINAKLNITVPEAAMLLNCSESHLYGKISLAKKRQTHCPIPFLDLDGVYVLPREKLLAWAEADKNRRSHLKEAVGR